MVQRSARARNQLIVDDLTIDIEAQTVHRGLRAVHLTMREFELLFVLMQSAPGALSLQDLSCRLWGDAGLLARKRLDIYLTSLRNKIDRNANRAIFHVTGGTHVSLM